MCLSSLLSYLVTHPQFACEYSSGPRIATEVCPTVIDPDAPAKYKNLALGINVALLDDFSLRDNADMFKWRRAYRIRQRPVSFHAEER